MLAALAKQALGRRDRLGVAKLGRKRGGGKADPVGSPAARRKAFLQVSMEQNMGCAVGACLGCVVMSTTGVPQRVCREGPVFAAEELVWEGAWDMRAKRRVVTSNGRPAGAKRSRAVASNGPPSLDRTPARRRRRARPLVSNQLRRRPPRRRSRST